MNLRLLLLPLVALLAASCAHRTSGTVSGRTGSASVSGSSSESVKKGNGYCMPRKHSCEHYEKEQHKKNPQSAKITRYRQECAEFNQYCR
jgi:hypothetical protein